MGFPCACLKRLSLGMSRLSFSLGLPFLAFSPSLDFATVRIISICVTTGSPIPLNRPFHTKIHSAIDDESIDLLYWLGDFRFLSCPLSSSLVQVKDNSHP